RDPLVTGVQTCALPIYLSVSHVRDATSEVYYRTARLWRFGLAQHAPWPRRFPRHRSPIEDRRSVRLGGATDVCFCSVMFTSFLGDWPRALAARPILEARGPQRSLEEKQWLTNRWTQPDFAPGFCRWVSLCS